MFAKRENLKLILLCKSGEPGVADLRVFWRATRGGRGMRGRFSMAIAAFFAKIAVASGGKHPANFIHIVAHSLLVVIAAAVIASVRS